MDIKKTNVNEQKLKEEKKKSDSYKQEKKDLKKEQKKDQKKQQEIDEQQHLLDQEYDILDQEDGGISEVSSISKASMSVIEANEDILQSQKDEQNKQKEFEREQIRQQKQMEKEEKKKKKEEKKTLQSDKDKLQQEQQKIKKHKDKEMKNRKQDEYTIEDKSQIETGQLNNLQNEQQQSGKEKTRNEVNIKEQNNEELFKEMKKKVKKESKDKEIEKHKIQKRNKREFDSILKRLNNINGWEQKWEDDGWNEIQLNEQENDNYQQEEMKKDNIIKKDNNNNNNINGDEEYYDEQESLSDYETDQIKKEDKMLQNILNLSDIISQSEKDSYSSIEIHPIYQSSSKHNQSSRTVKGKNIECVIVTQNNIYEIIQVRTAAEIISESLLQIPSDITKAARMIIASKSDDNELKSEQQLVKQKDSQSNNILNRDFQLSHLFRLGCAFAARRIYWNVELRRRKRRREINGGRKQDVNLQSLVNSMEMKIIKDQNDQLNTKEKEQKDTIDVDIDSQDEKDLLYSFALWIDGSGVSIPFALDRMIECGQLQLAHNIHESFDVINQSSQTQYSVPQIDIFQQQHIIEQEILLYLLFKLPFNYQNMKIDEKELKLRENKLIRKLDKLILITTVAAVTFVQEDQIQIQNIISDEISPLHNSSSFQLPSSIQSDDSTQIPNILNSIQQYLLSSVSLLTNIVNIISKQNMIRVLLGCSQYSSELVNQIVIKPAIEDIFHSTLPSIVQFLPEQLNKESLSEVVDDEVDYIYAYQQLGLNIFDYPFTVLSPDVRCQLLFVSSRKKRQQKVEKNHLNGQLVNNNVQNQQEQTSFTSIHRSHLPELTQLLMFVSPSLLNKIIEISFKIIMSDQISDPDYLQNIEISILTQCIQLNKTNRSESDSLFKQLQNQLLQTIQLVVSIDRKQRKQNRYRKIFQRKLHQTLDNNNNETFITNRIDPEINEIRNNIEQGFISDQKEIKILNPNLSTIEEQIEDYNEDESIDDSNQSSDSDLGSISNSSEMNNKTKMTNFPSILYTQFVDLNINQLLQWLIEYRCFESAVYLIINTNEYSIDGTDEKNLALQLILQEGDEMLSHLSVSDNNLKISKDAKVDNDQQDQEFTNDNISTKILINNNNNNNNNKVTSIKNHQSKIQISEFVSKWIIKIYLKCKSLKTQVEILGNLLNFLHMRRLSSQFLENQINQNINPYVLSLLVLITWPQQFFIQSNLTFTPHFSDLPFSADLMKQIVKQGALADSYGCEEVKSILDLASLLPLNKQTFQQMEVLLTSISPKKVNLYQEQVINRNDSDIDQEQRIWNEITENITKKIGD